MQAGLHVWPGGFHGFHSFVLGLRMPVTAVETRTAWDGRVLSSTSCSIVSFAVGLRSDLPNT